MKKNIALYPVAGILVAGLVLAAWMNTPTRRAIADDTAPAATNLPAGAAADSGVNLRRTVTVQVDDVDAYGASVLVLVFTINPNGTSGTVTSHGSYYKATENVGDSSIACEVSSGTAALTPGSAP